MSDQSLVDMLDDLHSTRMKLRLGAARRRGRPVATRKEEGPGVHAAADGTPSTSVGPLPSVVRDDFGALGGYL